MQASLSTPMMKQYLKLKKEYPDCLLFFRVGDFYELFLDDAHIGSQVLNITLTSRSKGSAEKIPLAGVPFHAVDSYLTKLVKAGYKVAICEQMSEPQKYGIVDREVVRIVTPGTVLDEKALEQKENNYIVSIDKNETRLGLAVADISTGKFEIKDFELRFFETEIMNILMRIQPSECILSKSLYDQPSFLKVLKRQTGMNIYCFQDWSQYSSRATEMLQKQFGLKITTVLGLERKSPVQQAAAALLGYLRYTQKDKVKHFTAVSQLVSQQEMNLDRSTIINLELFSTLRDREKEGSLVHLLDETVTAMGGRTLRDWIRKPLITKEEIEARHEAVAMLLKDRKRYLRLREILADIGDIERIVSRLSVGIGNARDLIHLMHSLKQSLVLKEHLSESASLLKKIKTAISDHIVPVISTIEQEILDEPAIDLRTGGLIKTGVSKELDTLRAEVSVNKDWIKEMEATERKKTGISSLKVRFNEVFGFYIEISKANIHLAPGYYLRKQTLVNGERFITKELKEKEERILAAQERINDLEYEIYMNVLRQVLEYIAPLQQSAQAVGSIDCLVTFAMLAEKYRYVRPIIKENGELEIENGRHPVVEQLLESDFVPNTVKLGSNKNQLMIITGPNMAGKSVLVRQVAMILFLSQIGSFVPADTATLPVVDRIFVRSGASDVITAGLSTFMVEMVETAHILDSATERSFIVMDEIGRGTSTYDGISIAWAIAEYLVTHRTMRPMTLFATHYHELQKLEDLYPSRIQNYHMAVGEKEGTPIFLHTLTRGSSSNSYGVAVAKLAGLPHEVVQNAKHTLYNLEHKSAEQKNMQKENKKLSSNNFEDFVEIMKKVSIDNTTPLQALEILVKLKNKL